MALKFAPVHRKAATSLIRTSPIPAQPPRPAVQISARCDGECGVRGALAVLPAGPYDRLPGMHPSPPAHPAKTDPPLPVSTAYVPLPPRRARRCGAAGGLSDVVCYSMPACLLLVNRFRDGWATKVAATTSPYNFSNFCARFGYASALFPIPRRLRLRCLCKIFLADKTGQCSAFVER